MTLAVPKFDLAGGYGQYRTVRRNMLETYALTLLRKFPNLRRIVGVTMEPPHDKADGAGSSEDLILAEAPEWTESLVKDLEHRQEVYDVAREGRYREYAIKDKEFPDVVGPRKAPQGTYAMNRKERRIMQAKQRRRRK
jgi:hypothetical protein